jgi:hypothetical protein
MDYKKIHDSIIFNAKNRKITGYSENHHIIPKCLGGDNKKENLVRLTAKEHWVIHQLLCEIYPKNYSLSKALECMMRKSKNQNRDYIISGIQYERIKEECSKLHSIRMKGIKRVPFTQEHKRRISESRKGKPTWSKGIKFSEEHKKNIGIASKNRINGDKNPMKNPEVLKKHTSLFSKQNNPSNKKIICEFCGIFVGGGNYTRWHGLNCKKNQND